MVKTYKQKFNEKHNQPIDKSNSIASIARQGIPRNERYKVPPQLLQELLF